MQESEEKETRMLPMRSLSLGTGEMAEQLRTHSTVAQTHTNTHRLKIKE